MEGVFEETVNLVSRVSSEYSLERYEKSDMARHSRQII